MNHFLILFFFSALAFCRYGEKETELKNLWIQRGCFLESPTGEQKSFPGYMCRFQKDGTFISAGESGLRKFSPEQKPLWEVKGFIHHSVNLSADQKKVYALSTETAPFPGGTLREDLLLVVDQETGNVTGRVLGSELLSQARVRAVPMKVPNTKDEHEVSHFNSVYEIPANPFEKSLPWMRRGNLIVNSLHVGTFFLSPDLKVVHHLSFEKFSTHHQVHDVQVTPQGELIYFNNFTEPVKHLPYSTIQKYNPRTKKITFEFRARPASMFFSAIAGGVQEIGDLLIFNQPTVGAYVYSKKKKDLVEFIPRMKANGSKFAVDQRVKFFDLKEFMARAN